MAGKDLDAVGELEEPAQRMEEALGALRRADCEVRASRVADEERVARQDEPRLVRPRRVHDREAAVLGPVTRRVDTAERRRPDRDLGPVLERVVRVRHLRRGVDGDRDPVLEREAAVAGDVVGVRVRLEGPDETNTEPFGLVEDRLDREMGVDDDRLAGLLAAHDVRSAAEIVVEKL